MRMEQDIKLDVGDALPPVAKSPVTRTTLALFAGASNDHNPIHIDLDVARGAGLDDVFAHGMLGMAYLGQVLTNWAPQRVIRRYSVRFAAITHVKDALTCTGVITKLETEDGERRAWVELVAVDQTGDVKLIGEAVVVVGSGKVNKVNG